ncbi:MAG: molybdenum ABC transporter ATP-binding protein [Roseovarius sp.]
MTLSVDLHHNFGAFHLDATFEATSGITAIFGPSGSGKSSIINMIAGLIHPNKGRIMLRDACLLDTENRRNVPVHKRRVGYVFQDDRLFPHLSVAGNIRFGTRFARRAERPEADVIDLLNLGPLLARLPRDLSGGERQRVALARALLSAPDMLLMDEPLAALDGPRKDEVLPYLEAFRDETGLPILYVTHAVDEVARLAGQLILLRDGQISASGPTHALLSDPANLPFLGVREAGSILRAEVLDHDPDGLTALSVSGQTIVLPGVQAKPNETLVIRVLAQDVLISLEHPKGLSSRNILAVTVQDLHKGEGPGMAVSLRLGDQTLLARITARAAEELKLRPGLDCYAIIKATTVPRSSIGRVKQG